MVSDAWGLVPILIYVGMQKEGQNRSVGYYSSPYLSTTYECKIKTCEQKAPQKRLGLAAL